MPFIPLSLLLLTTTSKTRSLVQFKLINTHKLICFSSLSHCYDSPTASNLNPVFRLLQKCSKFSELKQIHSHAITHGLSHHISLLHWLIRFCVISRPPNLNCARTIFDVCNSQSIILYNTMIQAYSKSHIPKKSLSIFRSILHKGISPDKYTFTFVIAACSRLASPEEGEACFSLVLNKIWARIELSC
ncbi:hypothetical protein AMTRI_Chr02g259280 [Amborella trichopoda]